MVDYIEKIQYNGGSANYIESDCFRGRWVFKYLSLSSKAIYNPDEYVQFSLDDYLPKDDYDYEVLASVESNTGNVINNSVYFWVRSGDNWMSLRPCAVRTHTASTSNTAGSVTIPIPSTSRKIGIYLEKGAHTSGNTWFRVFGYRRLGKNDWNNTSNKYVNKVYFNNKELVFGGSALTGKWVANSKTLLSKYIIPAKVDTTNGIVDIDVSNVIPKDGNEYECLFDGTTWTDSTNGHYIVLRAWLWDINTYFQVAACNVRSAASNFAYFNFRLPVKPDKKVIRLVNTGSSTATTNFRIQAYRRIGHNG